MSQHIFTQKCYFILCICIRFTYKNSMHIFEHSIICHSTILRLFRVDPSRPVRLRSFCHDANGFPAHRKRWKTRTDRQTDTQTRTGQTCAHDETHTTLVQTHARAQHKCRIIGKSTRACRLSLLSRLLSFASFRLSFSVFVVLFLQYQNYHLFSLCVCVLLGLKWPMRLCSHCCLFSTEKTDGTCAWHWDGMDVWPVVGFVVVVEH